MRDTILFPNPIVIRSEAKEQSMVLQSVRQQAQTEDQYIYHLTHNINNIVHEDGRIYMQLGEDGLLYANSVSPYAEKFWENVEPKIKPLVSILVEKRYLTYSSCEGHGYSFRRYVGLAFSDENSRQYVIDFISSLKIKGVKLNVLNSVSNQKIDLKHKRNLKYSEKYNPNEIEQKEGEVKSFNIQFHRKYEEYFFLEIIILEAIDLNLSFFKKPVYNLWLIWMKKFRWEKITKELTSALESDKFKKYKF